MARLVQVVEILAGALVVVMTLADAIGTLVVARRLTARWRLTRGFYSSTWRIWRGLARRLDGARREAFLSAYAPLTLLGLLAIWLAGLLFGWALVYQGVEGSLKGDDGFFSLVYYSGTCLFTFGFGDILATNDVLRLLALVEAGTGVATMALAISYLPALYAAYGRREGRLLTLDDPTGARITPTTIVVLWAPDGDLSGCTSSSASGRRGRPTSSRATCRTRFFRSQHLGQSWTTALGVVVDAATIACSVIPGADQREAYFMYRRRRRALHEIARRLHHERDLPQVPLRRDLFDIAHERIREAGLPVRSSDDAWERFIALRPTYSATLQSLIDYLLAPPGSGATRPRTSKTRCSPDHPKPAASRIVSRSQRGTSASWYRCSEGSMLSRNSR